MTQQSPEAVPTLRAQLDELHELTSAELTEALQAGASDDESWKRMAEQPLEFLRQKGVQLSERLHIVAQETSCPPDILDIEPGECPPGFVKSCRWYSFDLCVRSVTICLLLPWRDGSIRGPCITFCLERRRCASKYCTCVFVGLDAEPHPMFQP